MGTHQTGIVKNSLPDLVTRAETLRHPLALARKAEEKANGEKGQRASGMVMGKEVEDINMEMNIQSHLEKEFGKGLNKFNNEYWDAWGDESQGWYGDGSNWYSAWSQGSGMNVTMMLEKGEEKEVSNKEERHEDMRTKGDR